MNTYLSIIIKNQVTIANNELISLGTKQNHLIKIDLEPKRSTNNTGIGALAYTYLLAGYTKKETLIAVKEYNPNAKTTPSCIDWYMNHLKHAGFSNFEQNTELSFNVLSITPFGPDETDDLYDNYWQYKNERPFNEEPTDWWSTHSKRPPIQEQISIEQVFDEIDRVQARRIKANLKYDTKINSLLDTLRILMP